MTSVEESQGLLPVMAHEEGNYIPDENLMGYQPVDPGDQGGYDEMDMPVAQD